MEAAVIGISDELKGQVPVVFVTLKQDADADPSEAVREMQQCVVDQLGAIARPACIHVVNHLPKTFSGKLLRRLLLALVQGADPGDISTLDDPSVFDEVKRVLRIAPDLMDREGQSPVDKDAG